jgi:plasmid stabilization system protein ParE
MSHCIFTLEAEQDLKIIADYTIEKWGISQAIIYSEQLDLCFEKIFNKSGFAKRVFLIILIYFIFYVKNIIFFILRITHPLLLLFCINLWIL